MASFVDYGTHGTLTTPGGDVVLRPEQYAQFGVQPQPTIEEPPPPPGADPSAPLAPPIETPAFAPPPADPASLVSRAADPSSLVSRADGNASVPGAVGTEAPTAVPSSEPIAPPPDASLPPIDVRGATFSDVATAQRDAVVQGVDADAAMLAARTANNEQLAQAVDRRNAARDAEEAKWAARQAEEQRQIADATARYSAAVKEFADKKVDRRDYKVSSMQWIGVALSGIGAAYNKQGDKNPALDLLQSQIQQYVDDQYRAKESLGQNAAMAKDQIGVLRDQAANTATQKQLAVAAIMERHLRDLDAMTPRMQNQTAAAELQKLRAAGSERIAGIIGNTVQLQRAEDQQIANREQQERESRRSAYAAAARLKEDARQFNANYGLELQKIEASREAAAAKATSEAERRIAQIGVPDLAVKDGAGNTFMYQAREGSDANPGVVAQDVVEKFAAARTLDGLVAEGIRLRDAYKGDFGKLKRSPEWQKYTANIAAAGVAWSKLNRMGTWDNGTEKAVLGAMGGDPNRDGYLADLMEGLFTGKAQVGLEQFRQNAAKSFNDYANTMRRPGTEYVPWEPAKIDYAKPLETEDDERLQRLVDSKDPEQIRQSAAPSSVAKGLGYVASALDTPGDRYQTSAEIAADNFAASVAADASQRLTGEQQSAIDLFDVTLRNGTPEQIARTRKDLVAVATSAKSAPLQAAAIEVLTRVGDRESLAQIDAALTAGAKSTRQQEEARAPLKVAKAVASAPTSMQDIRAQLSSSDKKVQARALDALATVVSGNIPMGWKPPTANDRLQAQDLLRRYRGGR